MKAFSDLIEIVERLTAENGCPWDKVQTHDSIRINMVEEAYEALDAIDKKDKAAMVEELGDLLLQVVLHADIAKRSGEFCIFDVIEVLYDKLVSRHSHIFGTKKAQNTQEALENWEKEKAKEKSYISLADQLKRLPKILPALLRAQKIAKKSGFEAESRSVCDLANSLKKENAGEFLFAAAALAAQCGIDPEVELDLFNRRFIDQMSLKQQHKC